MTDYSLLEKQLYALLEGETDTTAVLANAASFIYNSMDGLNWAGFYLDRTGEELILGPFMGRPACVHIAFDRGVCGAAYSANKTLVVPDVNDFPGHIACDCASESEIVLPLYDAAGALIGVMDIDSPVKGRFTQTDAKGLEALRDVIAARLVNGAR